MSAHRWLLMTVVNRHHVVQSQFRYNTNNITKSVLMDNGHYIECSVLDTRELLARPTMLYVGPYYSIDEANEDLEFLKQSKLTIAKT